MSNKNNMVDERFELAALIFRLAERPEFNDVVLDYQKELIDTFGKYANHEAVRYAKEIKICYDKVFKFAVHIEKKNNHFVIIDNSDSLLIPFQGWNKENVSRFLVLFNQFYHDTNFADFFNTHINLYEQATQKFIDEVYCKIDFEWFREYVDPANLRCIFSLSAGNYAATVNNKIIYCQVFMWRNFAPIIHEYCHSF